MAAKKKAVTRNKLSNDAVPKHAKMYVAGIGASTGGLDALRPLISQLKSKGNVAFIVAQHLSPKHPSLLTELLNRQSEILVEFATEDGELLPDHVYVVPPNSNLLIENGRMKLIVPETGIYPHPSVDLLFQTIAENYGDHAVGVVLSGNGSDGSVGVEAIKAVGGIVIAQVPEEAEQNSMPSAAILTGVVDFQLSAKDIAAFLNSLGQSDARDAFSNVPKKVK
ncbi:MAG: chemotaxis protein CheB, partial [Chlorobiales bacterium]|nr:chemotaxis protein CheB [Chlorobiales bacterium]